MKSQSQKHSTLRSLLGQNRGQLVVEYILLIFVVVSIATLLTRSLVGRGDTDSGLVIAKWVQMIQMVGQDLGD